MINNIHTHQLLKQYRNDVIKMLHKGERILENSDQAKALRGTPVQTKITINQLMDMSICLEKKFISYQRGIRWNNDGIEGFINHGLIGNVGIPELTLNRKDNNGYTFTPIDGKHRVFYIKEFLKDKIVVPEICASKLRGMDIGGMTYSQIKESRYNDQFEWEVMQREVNLMVYLFCTDEECANIFLVKNSNVTLSSAEKRNAWIGDLRNKVVEFSSKYEKMFRDFKMSTLGQYKLNYDFADHTLTSQIFSITLHQQEGVEYKDDVVKQNTLLPLYSKKFFSLRNKEDKKQFNSVFTEMEKHIKTMSKLSKYYIPWFESDSPKKSDKISRNEIMCLYNFIKLLDEKNLKLLDEKKFMIAFLEAMEKFFVSKKFHLIISQQKKVSFGTYISYHYQYIQKDVNEMLYKHFMKLKDIDEILVEVDNKRQFTDKQKKERLEKVDYKCERCSTKLYLKKPSKTNTLTAAKAIGHHKVKHSDGGKTVMKNLEVICPDCHKKLH